ncbi:hypothetical protein FRC12_009196 [Ceratobasidium sp. 428]|nr:hypothetical protein FRC12_009196 [Ceratobasidium sp. 428]
MVSNKQHAADWKSQNAFAHFTELCNIRNHPSFSHVPPTLPTAKWFLHTSIAHGVWDGGNLTGGVQLLGLKLDRDWPEWAANTTNVLGVILHDMFADTDFFSSLELLPSHQSSITTRIRFEKLLYMEARVRHTWEWRQINHKSKSATCFHPGLLASGKAKPECAGHPINRKSRRMYSWRAYHEIMVRERRGKEVSAVENEYADDWVLV